MNTEPRSAGAGDTHGLVDADGITVRLGGRAVLENVRISVDRGEIVTLIGPNGSGKTTLVRVILGLHKPDRGHIRRRSDLKIGYVPQRLTVDPVLPLTGRRFLELGGRQAESALDAVGEEVGARDLLDQQIQDLSGGELQRMTLARALLRDPDLLVLDEPFQGVDFGGQLALFDLIGQARRRRGCGVLLVSHDLHLVMAGTDRVVCLNGHVCCSGKPDAVSRHPDYLALFGPRAAQSLAVYTHDHDHSHDLSGHVVPLPEQGGNGEPAKDGGGAPTGS